MKKYTEEAKSLLQRLGHSTANREASAHLVKLVLSVFDTVARDARQEAEVDARDALFLVKRVSHNAASAEDGQRASDLMVKYGVARRIPDGGMEYLPEPQAHG